MNNVCLIGRLTRDPEIRDTQSGMAIATFTLAVDRQVSKDKERQADFIRITVFGKQAETVDRYLSKGRQVAVHGRIQTGSYKDKEGRTVYTTDVIADRVEFLGSKNDYSETPDRYSHNDQGEYQNDDIPDSYSAVDDDMPF